MLVFIDYIYCIYVKILFVSFNFKMSSFSATAYQPIFESGRCWDRRRWGSLRISGTYVGAFIFDTYRKSAEFTQYRANEKSFVK